MPWFRDGLLEESSNIPQPDSTSPQSRLMGSAIRVLLEHYCTGMVLDTLDFSEVQWDDVLVAEDDCYVDIPRDLLPEPAGEDLWWQKLPPSVSLRDSQVSPSSSLNTLTLTEPILPSDTDGVTRIASPTLEDALDSIEGSDLGLDPWKGKKNASLRGNTEDGLQKRRKLDM
jgi:hypothetical protein